MNEIGVLLKDELLRHGADLVGFGVEISQCGKCIEVCPYTRRYLNQED